MEPTEDSKSLDLCPAVVIRWMSDIEAQSERTGQPVKPAASYGFMLECIEPINSFLPPVGHKAVEMAKESYRKGSYGMSLEGIRVQCWKWLEENTRDAPKGSKTWAAMRATICLLYTPGNKDFLDGTAFFLDLINRVESHKEEQIKLFKKWFRNEIEGGCIQEGYVAMWNRALLRNWRHGGTASKFSSRSI